MADRDPTEVDAPPSWLVRASGVRVRITASGISIGRSATSTIVLSDPEASRTHALLRSTLEGVCLWPVGRNPVLVDGEVATPGQVLSVGQLLSLPGEDFTLVARERRESCWVLEDPRGHLYGLGSSVTTIGRGTHDDIFVPSLAASSLRLIPQETLVSVERDSADWEEPRHEDVSDEGLIDIAGESWRVHRESTDRLVATTGQQWEDEDHELPSRALLTFRPNGATLVVHMNDHEVAVELSELRARLISVLLRPPSGYVVGDFIPNEEIYPRVWPRRSDRGATDLNCLVYWTRRSLVQEGLAAELIDRGKRSGGMRFRLAPRAEVVVR